MVTTIGDLPLGGVGHGQMGGCGGHEGSESYNGASSELHFDCLVVIVMLYLVGVLLDDVELVTGQSLKMKYYALYKKLVASTSRKKV